MLIKTIRRFFMNAYVGIPMLCLFALTSYNSFAGRSTVRDFTGEEIFKGVFFLEGDYSELIPELASLKDSYASQHMTPQQKQNLEAERSRIINYIKDKDADFFIELGKTIKTKDRIAIEKSFQVAMNLLENATKENSNSIESGQGDCVVVYCYYVTLWVPVFPVVYWDDTAGVDSKSSLFKEQMINSISETASVIG